MITLEPLGKITFDELDAILRFMCEAEMNKEAYNLLVSLAQRRYPELRRAWFSTPTTIDDNIVSRCLICDEEIMFPYRDYSAHQLKPIIDHGIQHLKESNLLPFL